MKRYSVQSAHGGIRVNTVEDSHGPFVKYDDVAQLLSDVRALQAEVEATRKWADRGGLEAQDKMDEQRAATDNSGALTRWGER